MSKKRKRQKRKRQKPAPAIHVAVTLPGPVAAKPVVTWQAQGRRLLIRVKNFLVH